MQFKLYDRWNSRIRIKYPDDWKKSSSLLRVKIIFTDPKNSCTFAVIRKRLTNTLDGHVNSFIANMEKEKIKVTRSNITLGKRPARKILFSQEVVGKKFRTVSILIAHGKGVYVLGYTAETNVFNKYMGIAKEMIRSFEIKD